MAADDEKFVAFLPVSKIIPVDPSALEKSNQPEEEKKLERKRSEAPATKKGLKTGAAVLDDDLESGTPNSFNRRDLVQRL